MPPIQLGPGFITLLLGFNALLLGLIALLLGLFALLLEQQGCKCAGTSLQGYLCAAAAAACAPPPRPPGLGFPSGKQVFKGKKYE